MDRKVTALKAQKRNPNRINLYLDGEFAFGISRITAAWLKIGQILSEEKITSLQKQDEVEVALQKAFVQLSYRPRSESEIQKKLQDAGFEDAVIEVVLERLRGGGLVQDQTFARTWIENRSTFRPRSRRFLAYELRQKGINEEIIESALNESNEDDQLAYQAACRYAARLEGLDWVEFRKKLSAFLGRRGFSYGTISPVVELVWREGSSGAEAVLNSDNEDDENG